MSNLPALATVETFRNQVICCDAMTLLRSLPAESVHCIVTSPPYYGLRDYGTAQWESGDPDCQHVTGNQVQDSKAPGAIVSGVRPGADNSHCRKCGAVRVDNQIGLEDTPQSYVQRLVELFREARRVLRNDGVLWLNLGDSYSSGGGGDPYRRTTSGKVMPPQMLASAGNLAHKQLIGIPWRVAFALQDDGWYLRSDIIWHKPNAMPESVKDRPTKAHEYVFLLAKSERYYYDADAIKEPAVNGDPASPRGSKGVIGNSLNAGARVDKQSQVGNRRYTGFNERWDARKEPLTMRNKRTVWTVPTKPLSVAHFATFPPALIEPMILAGCPAGGIVLDMFMGSGTVALVARRWGRNFIGCDLNPEYVANLSQKRLDEPFMVDMFEYISQERG